jgi:Arc/MetJ family transcription regulator
MAIDLMPLKESDAMRTTITIDDDLLAKATKLSGQTDRTAVIREALRALIERESAKRLALMGGTQRKLKVAPRRRQAVDT